MLESIAITVAPALAVVELRGRAEGRRADASTYETSATGSHDVSGGDVLPHCRAWRGSGGENGPRHMSTREESLGCGGPTCASSTPARGLPPPGTSLRVRYSLRGDHLSGKREEA